MIIWQGRAISSVNDRSPATVDARWSRATPCYHIALSFTQSFNMRPTFIFLNLLILLHHAMSLNILAIVSIPLRSHYMAFQTFFRELAARGHSVTVINNFPDPKPTSNLRFVDLKRELRFNLTTLEMYESMDPSFLHLKNYYQYLTSSPQLVRDDCESFFTNVNAQTHLKEGNKYDVILVELFISDCALVYAAANFDSPIIGITSHVLLPNTYGALGIPFDVAADTFFFTDGGPNPPLFSKVQAAVMDLAYYCLNRFVLQSSIKEVFQQYMPDTSLDVDLTVKSRMKMVFAYQHYSMTGARLLAPQLLEIGGLHISKPKPVPQDVEQFLSTADHGAIFVSFGSNLNMSLMSPQMFDNFLMAFNRIPQKVLFKWENDTFPTGYENVFTRKWFPQLDVLCHPKVVGFISHGGMLSSSEAVHCGKPVVTMPFFADQFVNSASLRAAGFAKTIMLASVTPENLADAIKEITSPEMQQQAQKVSKLWHDRPMPVMDSAIYWTEYVARHRDAPPPLPAKRSAWFEAMLLDVITIVGLILFLVAYICLVICKLVKSIVCMLLSVSKNTCRIKDKKH